MFLLTLILGNTNTPIYAQASIIDSLITDHYPIILHIIEHNSQLTTIHIQILLYLYNTINYNKLNHLIKLTNWVAIINDKNNANINVNKFTTTLQYLLTKISKKLK